MLKICPCCKYVSNLYQTITFTSLLRINTYLANICICPHFSRQRKCNANLELQIYHIFAPFANISKSVFSSSVSNCNYERMALSLINVKYSFRKVSLSFVAAWTFIESQNGPIPSARQWISRPIASTRIRKFMSKLLSTI